ncbi:KpsF/GutQ family sugar-phosphate isomerase [Bdellovibrionota bacterium FG-1]
MVPSIDILAEVGRVLNLEGQAILDCSQRLTQTVDSPAALAVLRAVELMAHALESGGKIIVSGVGKSGKVGQKIAATLCSTGSLAVFLHPTEGLHGDLGVLGAQDVVLALSYTGNTEELVKLLPSIKSQGVPVIGLGGNARSRIASQCDVWVDGWVDQEACPHNLVPTSSTTLALALGDAFAVALMQLRGFDVQSFAKNHPGGSLGRRLNLRVQDVMHQGQAVPTVAIQTLMDEVVVLMTQKKLGAVLVVQRDTGGQGERMLGIITEGDLRRALQYREKFFQLKAGDVMTAQPITAHPEMMAKAALDLMENRPSQISVLPVVDEAGSWKGLVRVHDLISSF